MAVSPQRPRTYRIVVAAQHIRHLLAVSGHVYVFPMRVISTRRVIELRSTKAAMIWHRLAVFYWFMPYHLGAH